jgi:branched-chain amino acid aminotransferase
MIGEGRRGPITTRIQKTFFDCVTGKAEKHRDWLTPVAA